MSAGHRLLLAFMLGGLGAASASAHGLDVVAVAEGTRVTGRATYDDMPARGDKVTLSLASAPLDTLATAITDGDGRFRFDAPPEARLLVVVEGDEGHVAEVAVRTGPARVRAAEVGHTPHANVHAPRSAQVHPPWTAWALAALGLLAGAGGAVALGRRRRARPSKAVTRTIHRN